MVRPRHGVGIGMEKIMQPGITGRLAPFTVFAGTLTLTLIGACSDSLRTTAIDEPVPVVSTPIHGLHPGESIRAATAGERTTSLFLAAPGKPVSRTLPREDDDDQWLFVEAVAEDAEGGVATGSFDPKGNQIRIHTEDVKGFAIDTSRIAGETGLPGIDWNRLVVIRINGVGSELRKRDYDVLHFVRDDHGRWEVAEP